MSQNRVGLTFEALIHENKKRPNNRLQKMLNQKLQNIESMRNDSERLHRKEKSGLLNQDLARRQRIYNRILGSLTRDLEERDTGAFRITGRHGHENDSDKLPPIGLGGIAPWTVEGDVLITNLEVNEYEVSSVDKTSKGKVVPNDVKPAAVEMPDMAKKPRTIKE